VTTAFVSERRSMWFDRAVLAWLRTADRCRDFVDSSDSERVSLSSLDSWMAFLKRSTPELRQRALEECHDGSSEEELASSYSAMSVEDVRDLYQRGHEIGSHTVSHPLLPQLDDESLKRELCESRAQITDWLGADSPTGFCYPNGDHNDRTARAAHAAGYEYACTTLTGSNPSDFDAQRLRRYMVNPARVSSPGGGFSRLAFRAELAGFHERIRNRVSGGR